MKQQEARSTILTEWRRLPESERQTEDQLVVFAMRMAQDLFYSFPCKGDRYQVIKGHLLRHAPPVKSKP